MLKSSIVRYICIYRERDIERSVDKWIKIVHYMRQCLRDCYIDELSKIYICLAEELER